MDKNSQRCGYLIRAATWEVNSLDKVLNPIRTVALLHYFGLICSVQRSSESRTKDKMENGITHVLLRAHLGLQYYSV